jgi:predicted nucleic acid-binding protein
MTSPQTYSLDANVLIQAWQKYYAPAICPSYWDVLSDLGKAGTLFLAEEIYEEITRTDDDLTAWLKQSDLPVIATDSQVIDCWKRILAAEPIHVELVHERRGRSLGDPWVVAHAMSRGATVVTKEEKITAADSKTVKIPNVCENMQIRCIDDFQFVRELNLEFVCRFCDPENDI